MPTNRTSGAKSARGKAASTSNRGARSRAVVVVPNDGLTDKERLFVEQYFICGLNGTEAALAVYDTTDRHVAAVMASDNLAKPDIRARVNERLEQFGLAANEVLARLAMHARGTMEDFIDPDSGAIDMKAAKKARQLHLVKKYRTKYTTFTDKDGGESDTLETEVELYDAQAALVHIGKHLNLFQVDQNININLTQLSDEELRQVAAGKKVISIEASK